MRRHREHDTRGGAPTTGGGGRRGIRPPLTRLTQKLPAQRASSTAAGAQCLDLWRPDTTHPALCQGAQNNGLTVCRRSLVPQLLRIRGQADAHVPLLDDRPILRACQHLPRQDAALNLAAADHVEERSSGVK